MTADVSPDAPRPPSGIRDSGGPMPFNEADFTRTAAELVAEGDRVPTQGQDGRMGESAAERTRRGWFADWDDEATTEYGWQPCLETGIGHIPCFEVWFKNKAECEAWIAENVVGIGWFPDDPTEIEVAPSAAARS